MERELNLIDIRRDKDSNFTVIEREELERLKKFEEKVLTALNTAISISYFMITMITILDIIIILSLL
nr:MAG TPA: hypothetical protein [Caudoviricetes sp.]